MGMTKNLATSLLEELFEETTIHSDKYLALFVDDPIDNNGNRQTATELSGTAYERLQLAAADIAVSNGIATVDRSKDWIDSASDDVAGDPLYAVLCSAETASGSPDTTVLWSAQLNPDADEILQGSDLTVEANAVTFGIS